MLNFSHPATHSGKLEMTSKRGDAVYRTFVGVLSFWVNLLWWGFCAVCAAVSLVSYHATHSIVSPAIIIVLFAFANAFAGLISIAPFKLAKLVFRSALMRVGACLVVELLALSVLR